MSSFIWYELMTDDARRATAFYGKVMGWTFDGDPTKSGPDGYRHIRRSDGGSAGGVLPLAADMKAGGARPAWVPYLYVADLDAALSAITRDGGRVLMPATKIEVGRFALVTDPQGVPFYVMTPVPPPGKPDAVSDVCSRTAPQRVSWNELASPDLAGAKAFYSKHFGFEFKESMPMGPAGDYCFLDQGGERIGAIMQRQDASRPALWRLYFRVPSIDAARQAIESAGGKGIEGPHQVPGGDWIVVADDPDGVRFGVVGARTGT